MDQFFLWIFRNASLRLYNVWKNWFRQSGKISSVRALCALPHAGAYLPGAMSERVNTIKQCKPQTTIMHCYTKCSLTCLIVVSVQEIVFLFLHRYVTYTSIYLRKKFSSIINIFFLNKPFFYNNILKVIYWYFGGNFWQVFIISVNRSSLDPWYKFIRNIINFISIHDVYVILWRI